MATDGIWCPAPTALRADVLKLCSFGNRFVGSPGERAARDYICDEFSAAGIADVRVEEFDVDGYEPGPSSCSVRGEEELTLPAVGLQFTASGVAEAEAVYVGNPRTLEDIYTLERSGLELKGKAVIVDTYWPYMLADHFLAAGAVAIVVISPSRHELMTHFTARLYPPVEPSTLPIPGVTIEARAASRLLALMGVEPRVISVRHGAEYRTVRTANVVAEIPGSERPDERVVVGAHYDTQLEGVGACDNATGVAALLELARASAQRPRRRTLVLVGFGDEEHGLHGAIDYCRRHADTLEATAGMVCLDALAWVYPGTRSLHVEPSLREFAAARSREAGWEPEDVVDASHLIGSDHNAFIDAGVPACWLWRYPPQHLGYHSIDDRPELIDFDLVARTAMACGHIAAALADADGPLERSRPTTRWHELRPALAPTVAGRTTSGRTTYRT